MNDESKGERERERACVRDRENIYMTLAEQIFYVVVCKMHYRRERNDFGYFSNV